MIWIGLGIAFAGWCIGSGIEQAGSFIDDGLEKLAEALRYEEGDE